MAKIIPFKGIFYNRQIIKNLKDVITPPYDVINTEEREKFFQKSPYNIIRIILGKEKNRYREAKDYFAAWQKDKVLCQDKKKAIYLYWQKYRIKGEIKEQFGFLALLKLENLKNSSVIPHEGTILKYREDRYKLLAATKANFSPIFLLYQDSKQEIEKELEEDKQNYPWFSFEDEKGLRHQVCSLTNEKKIRKLIEKIKNKNIYIADGHHRYLSALHYYQKNRRENSSFVLAYFTNVFSPSLSILPVHRFIRSEKKFEKIKSRIEKYFEVRKSKKGEIFKQLQSHSSRHSFGLYLGDRKFFLLILKDERIMDNFADEKDLRCLDVIIAHKVLIERFFKSDETFYFRDEESLIEKVDQEKGKSVAIFLNPIKSAQLMNICEKRKILPPKTTYFYPKIPAGLLIHRLV